MIFFWSKVYGLLGKTPYIYPRYQVWGVTDLGFDFVFYHPPLSLTLHHIVTSEDFMTEIEAKVDISCTWKGLD